MPTVKDSEIPRQLWMLDLLALVGFPLYERHIRGGYSQARGKYPALVGDAHLYDIDFSSTRKS